LAVVYLVEKNELRRALKVARHRDASGDEILTALLLLMEPGHPNIIKALGHGYAEAGEEGSPVKTQPPEAPQQTRSTRERGQKPLPSADICKGLSLAAAVALGCTGVPVRPEPFTCPETDEKGNPLGIVHRAIDLAHVFVDWEARVQVSDFGLALSHLPGRVVSTIRRPQGDGLEEAARPREARDQARHSGRV
jgi:hypothetical protein